MTALRQELGAALWRLADLVRADEGRRSFRAKAYRTAVWSLDSLPADLSGPADGMLSVPGIGPGVFKLIEEFRVGGRLDALQRLEAQYPRDVARLRRLPRMTPSLLRAIKGDLGIDDASDLIAAVEGGGLEALRGVGEATADRWARTLALAPSPSALPAYQAAMLAEALARHIDRHIGGDPVVSGAVRRLDEWVEKIDVVAEVGELETADGFLRDTAVAKYLDAPSPDEWRLRSHDGVEIGVHVAPPGRAGPLLIATTGPPQHAAALLDELDTPAGSEAEIYQSRGRMWIPPPARSLPAPVGEAVVRLSEIRGDLHVHSERSPDGRMTLPEICALAVDRGYEYLLITDHTSGLRFGGLDERALEEQRTEIEQLRPSFPDLVLLQGAELNIDREGGLDISDQALALLDAAVVGIHSLFDLEPEEQTARVVTVLQHPLVRLLAHPTGRRIGIRPGLRLDVDAVISAAIEHRVALEVNGHRDRLDLSAPLAATAVKRGALLAANSDAHRIGEMGNVANSVATMQKGGVSMESVVNAMPVEQFRSWLSGASFPSPGTGV